MCGAMATDLPLRMFGGFSGLRAELQDALLHAEVLSGSDFHYLLYGSLKGAAEVVSDLGGRDEDTEPLMLPWKHTRSHATSRVSFLYTCYSR